MAKQKSRWTFVSNGSRAARIVEAAYVFGILPLTEIFRYPVVMTADECTAECRDLFGLLYDAINELVNPELQDSPPERPESD